MSAESSSDVPQREAHAVQVQKRPNPGQRSQDHKRPKIAHRPTSPDHVRVAIFCALPVEAQAVKDFFDCCWDEDDIPGARSANDHNAYTLGAVGRHNVVLVHMPGMGKGHAAKAAADCLSSFPQVEVALLVGICGGVPGGDGKRNIILGDVVVSEYVVQSDFGRRLPHGLDMRKTGPDALERPNAKIRAHINKLKSDSTVEATYADLLSQNKGVIRYPGLTNDTLFEPTYRHKHHDGTCATCARCTSRADPACKESIHASCEELGCDLLKLIPRNSSGAEESYYMPSVHYGTYASADTVMRSGEDRDEIAKNEDIISFEMEAVGVWQSFPGRAIIIKGVCDYADSHKNKQWQPYAARTAAAYMKVFLTHWSPALESARTTTEADILQEEDNRRCLSDLLLTNPRDDKIRIEKTKGGLYLGASKWVLEHKDFRQWRESENAKLLWIRGDPGKGKTMLMITIINELEQRIQDSDEDALLAYFLCQGTDQNLNHATAVLRGLLYQLIMRRPQLISYLRKEYDHSGSKFFEGGNSFFALSRILKTVIEDPRCPKAYLIIDALDECSKQQHDLLKLISESATTVLKARWIVSSRPIPLASQHLPINDSGTLLVLEILENAQQVAQAVNAYIDFQIEEFLPIPETDHRRENLRATLRQKANGTFLWVALVIQELRKTPRYRVLRALEALPTGLTSLYNLMLDRARQQPKEDWELCQLILSTITLAFRPLHIIELAALSGMPADISLDAEDIKGVLELCGSFITVQDDDMVYVIHQSAQDYLRQNDKATAELFPDGQSHVHRFIYTHSLEVMTKTLKRNLHSLPHVGSSLELAKPGQDPLLHVRYSVSHWIDHLNEGPDQQGSSDSGPVYEFLASKLLNWLEALCLLQVLPQGITSLSKLASTMKAKAQEGRLLDLVSDILRFVRYFKSGIERTPLQIYASGLVFSPKNSLVGSLYRKEQPKWIQKPHNIPANWSTCKQVLEGHCDGVKSVAFSPDGTQIASGSRDETVRVWDTETGVCRHILEGHHYWVSSVAFSPDGAQIASASWDKTIRVWRTSTGVCSKILEGHTRAVTSVAFSPDGTCIASASDDSTVRIWRADNGACEKTLKGHSKVTSVAFSPDGTQLAWSSTDGTIRIWCTNTGGTERERTYNISEEVYLLAFSLDGTEIAAVLMRSFFRIRFSDERQGALDLYGAEYLHSLAFLPDGKRIATASPDKGIQIWNLDSKTCEQTLQGHTGDVWSMAVSPAGTEIASGDGNTVRIWVIDAGGDELIEEEEHGYYRPFAISPDGTHLATGCKQKDTIRVWHTETRLCSEILEGGRLSDISFIVFSPDGSWLASISDFDTIQIWHVETGVCHATLGPGRWLTYFVAISPNNTWLASHSRMAVRIWRVGTWTCERVLDDRKWEFGSEPLHVAFSKDSTRLALAREDGTVSIWSTATWVCERRVQGDVHGINPMTFSPDGTLLRLASGIVIALSDAPSEVSFPCCGVSKDKRWITWNGRPILWLPIDYIPGQIGISASFIAIYTDSSLDRIVILPFDFPHIQRVMEGL